MERIQFTNMNEIILEGPIVRKFKNDVACNLTIKVLRRNLATRAMNEESLYNYPEISFYGTEKDIADNYKEGDVVKIKGMIQVKPKLSKETDKEYYEQQLVGFEIEEAEKVLMREFGYDDGAYVASNSMVKLGGVISRLTSPSNGVLRINIRTFTNGRVNNIQTFLYTRNIGDYLAKYHIGDRIFAIGTIQTPDRNKIRKANESKTEDKKTQHFFRNIVLDAICKAD